jgi:hypothetical protein
MPATYEGNNEQRLERRAQLTVLAVRPAVFRSPFAIPWRIRTNVISACYHKIKSQSHVLTWLRWPARACVPWTAAGSGGRWSSACCHGQRAPTCNFFRACFFSAAKSQEHKGSGAKYSSLRPEASFMAADKRMQEV